MPLCNWVWPHKTTMQLLMFVSELQNYSSFLQPQIFSTSNNLQYNIMLLGICAYNISEECCLQILVLLVKCVCYINSYTIKRN